MFTAGCVRAFRVCAFGGIVLVAGLLMGQGCPDISGQLVVDAGPDLAIQSGSVVLQATVRGGSGVYTYSWTPTVGLDRSDVLQPVLTAGTPGTITYTLTVQDSLGATASDSVRITVGASGDGGGGGGGSGVLKADAGPDKFTAVGSSVVLEGSASGGVAPYSFLWSPISGLSSATQAQPVYTPVVSGTVSYTLTVTDALGATASDSVTINISPAAGIAALTWGADYGGGGYQVLARFDQQLDPASATNIANYRIDGRLNPISATLGADGRTVSLVFNERLSSFAKLDLGVGGGLRDAKGGVMEPALSQAIGPNPEDVDQPTAVMRTWGSDQASYTVIIEFSEAMDGTSAEDIHNYLLAGSTSAGGTISVQPTQAVLDASGKVVTLTFEGTAEGFRQTDLLKISSEVRDINRRENASVDWDWIDVNPADSTGPTAPALARVWGINQTRYQISVTFNEVLDKASAEEPSHYELGGNMPQSTTPGVKPVALDASGRTVVLTFEGTVDGLCLTDQLRIVGVTDINGQPTSSTEPTPVTANLVDMAGPSLSAERGRVWGENQTLYLVKLTFSEVLDKTSATNPEYYQLAAAGGADTIRPTSVTLDGSGRIVTLVFADSVTGGLNITDLLTVSDQVKDINGRAHISTSPAPINVNPTDVTPPMALSRTWGANKPEYEIQIEFSEVMDRLTTTRLANYRLHREGEINTHQPSSVVLDPTGRIATLTFATTGSNMGGVNYDDPLEIMPAVTDINGRSTTSITTVGADVARNTADVEGPSVVRATLFQQPPAEPELDPETTVLYWIDVVFNEVLDKLSAEQATYTFAGANVQTATVRPDGRTVRLVLDATEPDAIDPSMMTLTIPDTVLDINHNAAAETNVTVRLPLKVDAGDSQTMLLGETIVFSPTVSGGIGPYTASWSPAVAELVTANDLEPDFTPTKTGTYTFTLTVTDSEGRTASDAMVVKVSR